MPNYRRYRAQGGTYFFTLKTEQNAALFVESHASQFRYKKMSRFAVQSALDLPSAVPRNVCQSGFFNPWQSLAAAELQNPPQA